MGAYNRLDGVPCCGSEELLENHLRGRMGFEGYVVSDCGAIYDFYNGHGTSPTRRTPPPRQ
jgi:beta-glucosidase